MVLYSSLEKKILDLSLFDNLILIQSMDIDIRYKRNNMAKYLRIKVLNNRSVEVVVPPYLTHKQAENFLKEHLSEIEKRIATLPDIVFGFGEYRTHYHRLIIKPNILERGETKKLGQNVVIKINPNLNLSSFDNQSFIQNVFIDILRFEAKQYIPNRVFELAQEHDLHYGNIKINSAKTRWGSCSSSDNLNFSCYLMILPKYLIDYVILHELSHTVYKNHSRDFYRHLDILSKGKHAIFNNELKKYSIVLNPDYFKFK